MPLFLDLHKAADYEVKPTVEEIKKNHIADLAVQKKYGVRFIQYWINEDEGQVFCLMEGPDKEACAAVHREAHGAMPCNVIELKGGDYKTYMGDAGKANEFDIVENPDGTFDTGNRVFLAVDIFTPEKISTTHSKIVKNAFQTFYGREVNHHGERMLAAFNSGTHAAGCARHILDEFKSIKNTEVQVGISAGHPLTDKDNFFEAALKLTHRLCDVAGNGQVLISSNVKGLLETALKSTKGYTVRMTSAQEEKFLNHLLDITETSMDNANFDVENICKGIGLSRAQLYRKVISLTGLSPNNFIKERRLKRALLLIKQKYGNIAEVAYETGFNNPSYFATVFQKRFGMLPSQLS
jgi:AraC-like DNA-binding protein